MPQRQSRCRSINSQTKRPRMSGLLVRDERNLQRAIIRWRSSVVVNGDDYVRAHSDIGRGTFAALSGQPLPPSYVPTTIPPSSFRCVRMFLIGCVCYSGNPAANRHCPCRGSTDVCATLRSLHERTPSSRSLSITCLVIWKLSSHAAILEFSKNDRCAQYTSDTNDNISTAPGAASHAATSCAQSQFAQYPPSLSGKRAEGRLMVM